MADQETSSQNRLFLERRGYIQRRVIDAARLLPVVGFVLFMVPLIWPRAGDADAVPTSVSFIYIFVIWFVLILIGGFLAQRIGTISEPRTDDSSAPAKDPSGGDDAPSGAE